MIEQFLKQILAEDSELKSIYEKKNMTEQSVGDFVIKQAKEYLHGHDGMVEDKVVKGWVIHYIQDGDVIIKAKPKVKPEPEPKAKKKESKSDYETISLFD